MRVAVAEDVAVYRAGLIRFLEAAGVEVIHEAVNGDEMLANLRKGELPDVAIMDINMNGREDDGLVCADRIGIEYPSVGILLLSAWAEATYAERLFARGSAGKGYMLKDTLNSVPHLREALERVAKRLTYCDPKIVDQLIAKKTDNRLQNLLSPREQRILELLASGASNEAIVDATSSSAGAVESALGRIYAKLNIPRGSEYTPRVLAVLRWLDGS